MLIHINTDSHQVEAIEGAAHMVVSIGLDGQTTLRGFFAGRTDALYAPLPDDRLLTLELPKLLEELRAQIQALTDSEAQWA